VSAVEIRGLEAWQAKLAAAGAAEPIQDALREEAEAIAEGARREAPGRLGGTVEVIDRGRELEPAYAIGSAHRAARFVEFGTVRRPAAPWLWPVFRARSQAINHRLRKVIAASFQRRSR
jgi:hypothetical protein